MSRVPVDVTIRSKAGRVQANVDLNIYERGTTTPVTVYEEESGGTTLTQPLTTNSEGQVEAWVEEGPLDLHCSDDDVEPTRYWDAISATSVALIREAPLNVKDAQFGAVGDDSANDAAAIDAVLAYAKTASDSEIYFPPGRYKIASPVAEEFLNEVTSLRIKGCGSASALHIACTNTQTALEFGNLESLVISDLTFVGTPGPVQDAKKSLRFGFCEDVRLEGCEFYGLVSDAADGAVVEFVSGGLKLHDCHFRGCSASGGIGVPVVKGTENFAYFIARDTKFLDYGTLDGVSYSKPVDYQAAAWITMLGPTAAVDNALKSNVFVVEGCVFDEGAYRAVAADGNNAYTRLPSVVVRDCAFNNNQIADGAAVKLNFVEKALVEDCWVGWGTGTPPRHAIYANQVNDLTVNRLQTMGTTDNLTVGPNNVVNLRIRNSTYTLNLTGSVTGVLSIDGRGVQTLASAATIAPSVEADLVNVTGTTGITSITATKAGHVCVFKFAGALTVTDGSNLKLNGDFPTSADDTLTLTCDGTNWSEIARSVN